MSSPYAYIPARNPGLLCIEITDMADGADEDGNTAQTTAAFSAAPAGTQDYGDSNDSGISNYGTWTYTLRLSHKLYGAAAEAVVRKVTKAVEEAAR